MRTRISMLFGAIILIVSAFMAASCKDEVYQDDNIYYQSDTVDYVDTKTVKVAIIAPMTESFSPCWRRIISMFEDNYAKTMYAAKQTFNKYIKFQYEWHDERTEDMDQLGDQLTSDSSIVAIIGPMFAQNLKVVGSYCKQRKRLLISPRCTNFTEVRDLTLNCPTFFSLVETDFSETQMILATMKRSGISNVCMAAPNTDKGRSYTDYFDFWCKQFNISNCYVGIYDPNSDKSIKAVADTIKIVAAAYKALGTYASSDNSTIPGFGVIYVPETVSNIEKLNDWTGSLDDFEALDPNISKDLLKYVHLYYANTAFTPENTSVVSFQGCGVSAEPESGFQLEYQTRYDDVLFGGMAQLYDAMLLLTFAEYKALVDKDSLSIADEVRYFMEDLGLSTYDAKYVWNPVGMSRQLTKIATGEKSVIGGASGLLLSDSSIPNLNMIGQTVYSLYSYDGITKTYTNLEYASKSGTSKSGSSWDLIPDSESDETDTLQYAVLKENWALLVAASEKWQNYRHQADVLTMYQMLKEYGFDDRHIILIEADDIDHNANYNKLESAKPYYGQVINWRNQNVNVEDSCVDYKLSDLMKGKVTIEGILTGKYENSIHADTNSNVFVFWSGHGQDGALVLGDGQSSDNKTFTYNDMKNTLDNCQGYYRRMLWIIETCFSGSVGKACEAHTSYSDLYGKDGYKGVLCITAANESEVSISNKAKNADLDISVSNNFTMIMDYLIDLKGVYVPILELYNTLYSNSMGSHAQCYNQQMFGNIKDASMDEFMVQHLDW